jgi:hypothetical protein
MNMSIRNHGNTFNINPIKLSYTNGIILIGTVIVAIMAFLLPVLVRSS